MDDTFLLDELTRRHFFRTLMNSFGCTYFCLWSYVPRTNCLIPLDGYFNEENEQASTSSGSLARNLFSEYRQSIINLENDHVPGLAFRNNHPFIELRGAEIKRRAQSGTQRQFYQEARIQTAIFMGCKNGEIELGISNIIQINMEMGMRELFPDDFLRQFPLGEFPHPTSQEQKSSSSSTLRSLDSPSEYSPFTFNIQRPSLDIPPLQALTTTTMETLSRIPNIHLPNRENEEDAITRAILAVLTSPCSSTSSSTQQNQNLPYHKHGLLNRKTGAFKRYNTSPKSQMIGASSRRPSMIKRAISYYQRLNILAREHILANRPTTTQLHHMISERKRREKLNESFQALRSLLPTGTKKDKASVLSSTREHITSLKGEIAELMKKNQELEAQLLHGKESKGDHEDDIEGNVSERVNVRVVNASESTSQDRVMELRVIVRGECGIDEVVISLLEFLKQLNNVSLISMEARTLVAEQTSFAHANFTLKIEGEWDEAVFQEAVRRVVADLPH